MARGTVAAKAAKALRRQQYAHESRSTVPVHPNPSYQPFIFPTRKVTQEDAQDVVEACASRLSDKWDIEIERPISCGRQGCVYENKSPRKGEEIVKLTVDAREAQVSDWISRLGEKRPSILPKIKRVFDLTRCSPFDLRRYSREHGHGSRWFAVTREDIPGDFSKEILGLPGVLYKDLTEDIQRDVSLEWSGFTEGVSNALADYLSDYESYAGAMDRIMSMFQYAKESEILPSLSPDKKKLRKAIEEVRDFGLWALQEKAYFADMHELNWGLRKDGSLVLRDLGFGRTDDEKAGDGVELAALPKTAAQIKRALVEQGPRCPGMSQPLDLQAGAEALEFLKRRTKEDPWFAGLTLVFHSGPFPYSEHQMVLEEALVEGAEAVTTIEGAKAASCNRKITGGSQRAKVLPFVAKKWLEKCGRDGCRTDEEWKRFLTAIRGEKIPGDKGRGLKGERPSISLEKGEVVCENDPPAPTKIPIGMGAKIRELVREYLGDEDAVALDRHAARWLCEDEGVTGKEAKKACKAAMRGQKCSGEVAFGPSEYAGAYATLRKAMQDKAKEIGVSAAVLQVSAWWARVCGSSKCAWLGAAKKLTSSAPGTALCEVEKDLTEACSRAPTELSSPSGSLRFCSIEKKMQVCEDFRAKKIDARKAFGKYRRVDHGGKSNRSRKGASARAKKGLSGLDALPASCDRAGVEAVKHLVKTEGNFG